MHQRKKNQNKENFKAIKKTTLQQINYTQQLHIPTYATMELRQAGRSIELKKSSSKKPVSRKSRCISVKQSGLQPPLNIKQLLKQFKSMKLIRSRSKSPRSSKSKPKSKKSTKKITHTQINSKSNSELNLTAKLERTLQKLKQSSYFRDEDDSQIPLISTSEAFTQEQKKKLQYIFSGETFEDINIRELRLFCKNKEPGIKMNLEYFKGNIYELMARRIQRAWRRYRTHQLVQRYANMMGSITRSGSPETRRNNSEVSAEREQIMISSEQLYPQEMVQRKITYISNLEEESDQPQASEKSEEQDSTLYHLKKEQLEKWSEIISIINNDRTQNPQQTQKLLKKLMNKSELNRKNLELQPPKAKEQLDSHSDEQMDDRKSEKRQSKDQKIEEREDPQSELQKLKKKLQQQKSSFSQDSVKQIEEEFNSKKYIEYLDSDMYPIVNHKSSITTICKEKQQSLLNKLQEQSSFRRLIKGSKFLGVGNTFEFSNQPKSRLSYRSNSELSSASSIQAEQLRSSRKIRDSKLIDAQIRKSTSQKNFKYSSYENLLKKFGQENEKAVNTQSQKQLPPIKSPKQNRREIKLIQVPENVKNGVEEDSECIMRRELEEMEEQEYQFISDNPLSQNNSGEKAYLQDQFKKQIEQLHRIREEDSEDEDHKKHTLNEVEPILHRSSNNDLQRVRIQDYDHNIESDEDNSSNGQAEKGESITEMLTSSLMIQFLIQVAKYPYSILKSFKNIAIKKPKLKRAPAKAKKNGFVTNQAEIKSFIQDLCFYVMNEEPQIFKNLEKATGPSALQMLRYMHQSVENDIYIEEEEDDPSIMILPNWAFETFWGRKALSIKYDRQGLEEEREKQRQQYLKGLNKIFLRSCFDCLNQCLDYERNYGPFGKPFPWKRSHYFDHIKSLQQTRKSVQCAQKRLFEISSTYCGIIIEKEEIASLGGNEDYIAQVQQDRLSRMLAQDLVEGEERWIFYDDEETELLVEASNTVFHEMVEEVLAELVPSTFIRIFS